MGWTHHTLLRKTGSGTTRAIVLVSINCTVILISLTLAHQATYVSQVFFYNGFTLLVFCKALCLLKSFSSLVNNWLIFKSNVWNRIQNHWSIKYLTVRGFILLQIPSAAWARRVCTCARSRGRSPSAPRRRACRARTPSGCPHSLPRSSTLRSFNRRSSIQGSSNLRSSLIILLLKVSHICRCWYLNAYFWRLLRNIPHSVLSFI